jgi:hypothetical protein
MQIVRSMPSVIAWEDRGFQWLGDSPYHPIIENAARRYAMSVTSVVKVALDLMDGEPDLDVARETAEQDLEQVRVIISNRGSPQALLWAYENCCQWIKYWSLNEPDPELRERFRQSAEESERLSAVIRTRLRERECSSKA